MLSHAGIVPRKIASIRAYIDRAIQMTEQLAGRTNHQWLLHTVNIEIDSNLPAGKLAILLRRSVG
ncbi:hypothetical protein KT99_12789 [Shewanella benthica KT99]|uniref:Uncharacterized protein n=1 Tax=Shewanella benthica KT99 TaxID=314608 RepID=A9CZ52_9GAMM|nr:hypothetical protein KT99_12789 [Shewanella benthica KT99]